MEERSAAVSCEQRQKKLDKENFTVFGVIVIQQHHTWPNVLSYEKPLLVLISILKLYIIPLGEDRIRGDE